MNIFDRLFGQANAPAMSVGEMVGGAAADPSQLMDQLANRERTAAVTNYMLQDSPFAQIAQAPIRGAMGVADVLTGQKPYEAVYPDGSVRTAPQFIGNVADVAGSVTVGAGFMPDAGDLRAGIKLPMDDASRAARAAEQGFDPREFYHGSGANLTEIDPAKAVSGNYGKGFYVTRIEDKAAGYAPSDGGSVYPMRVKFGTTLDLNTPDGRAIYADAVERFGKENANEHLASQGYDSIRAPGESVVLRPENVRSRFAAFDPEKRGSRNILDMLPLAVGGGLAVGAQLSAEDRNRS